MLCHATENSRLTLACATESTLESPFPHGCKTVHGPDFGQVAFTIEARSGQPVCLSKYMVYHTSQTATAEELCGRAEWTLDRVTAQGFDPLLSAQARYLDDFWRRSDVRIKDVREERTKRTTVEIQQAIRFNLFHILQASARAEGTGVPAKGLTGQSYEGHYFWDTEIYLLPFLTYTSPQIAKNLLTFRYNMLERARARARELGHRGAMFPWRTINGEEASAYYAAGTAQYHINADIMYALRKYVQATGDDPFLRDCGAEMLVETARLWTDLGFFSDAKGGKFCINGVTGPDEYNAVVNNNAYTNLMARENLRYAIQVVEALRAGEPDAYNALVQKTALDPSEPEAWSRAADNMYVPYDETLKIIPQDDSFLDREPWDFRNTPPERYPLLLFYHPLNIYRKQVIKQADVVLAMFLLGDAFSHETKKRNFDFYDPLTTGDSSLSSCVEAIIAAQTGDVEKAIRYGMAALLMDLADVGGNVKDGCHIASMAGTWMMLTYGFGGMRDDDGMLSFWPRRAPQDNAVASVSRDVSRPDAGNRDRAGQGRVRAARGRARRDPPRNRSHRTDPGTSGGGAAGQQAVIPGGWAARTGIYPGMPAFRIWNGSPLEFDAFVVSPLASCGPACRRVFQWSALPFFGGISPRTCSILARSLRNNVSRLGPAALSGSSTLK